MKKQINPNLLALAKQTCNHELEMPDMNKLEKQKVATTDAHDLKDYIWVPSAEIYVAKQRTHLNLNWNQTHEQLNQEGLFMPTIPQFIEFIKYLKSQPNNQKYQQILDDILTIREPWRANWLDAYFEQRNDGMYVLTKNKTYAEKLEPCLTEDKTPGISLEHWLNNSTKQGLPKPKCEKGENMDAESWKLVAKSFAIAIGGAAPAIAIGKIASKGMESIGRNPESGDKLFVPMLLGMAFAEAIAIYALVVTFTL